jgi:hypothetical protein
VTVFLGCGFAANIAKAAATFPDRCLTDLPPPISHQPSGETPRGKALFFPFLTQLNFCYFSGFMAFPEELACEKGIEEFRRQVHMGFAPSLLPCYQ